MVEIKLGLKTGNEYKYKFDLDISSSTYENNFEKILYKIKYKETFEQWNSSWISTYYTYYVYIYPIDGSSYIFTYKANVKTHVVQKVEAYYNRKHPTFPLVIGFGRSDGTHYNTYAFIKKCGSHRGYPPNSFKSGDSEEVLKQRLKAEDDRVNRIKFYNTGGSYKNCQLKTDSVGDQNKYVKHWYTADDKNRYEDHILTKDKLFSHEPGIEVNDAYFQSIHDNYFDEVNVYCSSAGSKVLLVEFIKDKTKKHFVRQDCYGYYWTEKTGIDKVDEGQLTTIQTESDSKLSYLINKNGTYRGVTFTNDDLPSFQRYSHKPDSGSTNINNTFIFYGTEKLHLEENQSFNKTPKFTGFENKHFTEVCLYYWKFPPASLPKYLKLTEKSQTEEEASGNSEKTYCLERTNETLIKWKQVEDPGLDTVLTFLIDHKDNGEYNKSIDVTYKKHDSFNVYEHTPKTDFQGRIAYLLFNFKFLELQNSDFKKEPKLKNIQLTRYSKVLVYLFKKTTNKQNPNLPLFLILTEKPTETGTGNNGSPNTYCLQRTDDNGINWKQIEDPSLDNTITFLIEKRPKETESYNDSIDVKSQTHSSFNVYEHTPKGTHTNKKAYLLYDYNFLQLETAKPEVTPKLDTIQLKCYQSVKTYYFKSIGASYNATIPIYLEFTEKIEQEQSDDSSKIYHLQRTDNYGIKWKQITDPTLGNAITFLLDYKQYNPYNNNSVTVEKGNHVSFDVYTHKPQDSNKLGLLLYHSALIFLDNSKLPEGADKLDKVEWKNYCEISLYYFKLSNNESDQLPTYLELKIKKTTSGSGETKTYFLERQGQSGNYWVQIEDPKLANVITYLLDKKPSSTTDKYNDESITITKEPNSSFDVIAHKPIDDYRNNKGYLLYKEKFLNLVANEHLGTDVLRLEKFNEHIYRNITLFYYKETGQNTLPTFLELKVKGETTSNGDQQGCHRDFKCYLLQRSDDEGVKWRQIKYQDLRKTVTYQLEFTRDKERYNENSVNVSKVIKDSFDVYTHTLTEKHEKKLGLFLYKWKTLTLQPNSELQGGTTTIIKNLHGTHYCKVLTYYSKTYSGEPPLFLELFEKTTVDTSSSSENCQCPETNTSCKCYWLQRVDPEGYHWKPISRPDKFDSDKAQQVVPQIFLDNKNSIVVKLTERNWYDMKTIKHYEKIGTGSSINPPKKIEVGEKNLSRYTYKYFTHYFSQSYGLSTLKIFTLRLFMVNIEIGLIGSQEKKQTLNYNPHQDIDKMVYVYFNVSDTAPLLFYYDDKWYCPNNKENYFVRWNITNDLELKKPGQSSDHSSIKNKLDNVNKSLNYIDLSKTTDKGYGIKRPGQTDNNDYYKSSDNKFDGKRIDVKPENVEKKFGKVTHSTKNGSSIGKVMYNGHEIQDERSTKLSNVPDFKSGNFISVISYYHLSDKTFNTPLLLGFTKFGGTRIEAFYERLQLTENSQWKKIEGSDLQVLRQGDDKISEKINTIHYTIGKSIKILVDQQPGGESGNYPVQLVENKEGVSSRRSVLEQGGSNHITVKKSESTSSRAPPQGYTSFTHSIPPNVGSTSSEYVSGLRLYVCDKHLPTNLSIYYDTSKNDVKVYFYGGDSSGNPPLDKIPLLVEYEGTYFKPRSRDDYFNSWEKVDVSSEETRGDALEKGKPLQEVLDGINKDLNTIELDNTGGGSNNSYGLTNPVPETGKCCNVGSEEFCKRVSVTRNGGDGGGNYLKVTHTTYNKGPIRDFTYKKDKITEIKIDELENGCNKVDVYYLKTDQQYENPLLIYISSDCIESSQTCTGKWFHRKGVKLTDWNDADNKDLKYGDDSSIKQELEKIQVSLSNYLLLDIYQQKKYSGYVQKGSDTKTKQNIGQINVDGLSVGRSYKAQNYRHYQHNLNSYYEENKEEIRNKLKLESQGDDLTLQVSIYLVSININILGTTGDKLTYGKTEASRGDSNDPYVYFYEGQSYGASDDTVPFLFKYGDNFFGPNSKKEYFTNWKDCDIKTEGTGDIKEKIKKELDRINLDLNEIDLNKKGVPNQSAGYGLDIPVEITELIGFNTKRIEVTQSLNQGSGTNKYTTVTHKTVNGYNIGSIGGLGSSCTFDNQHTRELSSQKHDEAVAVYASVGTDPRGLGNPSLVLITENKRGRSTVHGYYIINGCSSSGNQYKFQNVTQEFNLSDLDIKDGKSTRKSLNESHNELYNKLKSLGLITKTDAEEQVPAAPQAASSDGAQGMGGLRTDDNRVQDDRPKVGAAGGHGQVGSGGAGGMGASAKGEPGAPGPELHVEQQQQESKVQEQHVKQQQQESQVPEVTNGHGAQENQRRGDGVEGGGNGGEASPSKPGSSSSGNESTIAQSSEEDGFMATLKKPEVYASASGTVGAGVMATVGAVVYKK